MLRIYYLGNSNCSICCFQNCISARVVNCINRIKASKRICWVVRRRHYVALLDVITPRKILLHSATTAILVMYTDASFEPSQMARPGMDIICSQPGGLNFQGITSTVTELVLDALQETATQIAPLEALAVGPLGKACVSKKLFLKPVHMDGFGSGPQWQ